MARLTDHLKLLQLDPDADGKEPFDVKAALNDNWSILDSAIGDVTEAERLIRMETGGGAGALLAALVRPGRLHLWRKYRFDSAYGTLTFEEMVVSVDPDAYPRDGSARDGHYWVYEGTLAGRSRIVNGSYTGTGAAYAIPCDRLPAGIVLQPNEGTAVVLVQGDSRAVWADRSVTVPAALSVSGTVYHIIILYGD